ncbi:MAG: hypothetical protein OCC49_09270 [Fibrobacterales bacterium]
MQKVIVILVLAAIQMSFSQKSAVVSTDTTNTVSGKKTIPSDTTSIENVIKSLNIKPTIEDSTSQSISKKYSSTKESVKDIYKKEIEFKRSKETTETLWLVSRITLGVSSLGMATMGFLHTGDAEDKLAQQHKVYGQYLELDDNAPDEEFNSTRNNYDSLEKQIDTHIAKASIYYGLSFFLTAGFFVTFAF